MTAILAHRKPRSLVRTALIVVTYLCVFVTLDLVSHQFEGLTGTVAWYPPAGLTYALLLVFGARFVPAVTIALLVSGVFVYHMPQPLHLIFLWALVISSVYGVAAAFLHRRIHFDWHLCRSRDVVWLVVTAVSVSALLAILSVSSSALTSDMPRNEVLRATVIWWIGETVGVLTITPFLLVHVMPLLKPLPERGSVRSPARQSFRRPMLSVIGQAFSIAFLFYWVFAARGLDGLRPMYLITLPLIWIALDHSFRGVATGIVVLNSGVMLAMSPFRFDLTRFGELQLLMIVNCIVGLLMGAVVMERKRDEQALAENRTALVEAQAMAHIGDWSMNTTNRRFVWSEEMYVIHGLKPDTPISHETYAELIHPEDRKRVFGVMGFAMASRQQEFSVDCRIVRPDGTERFVTLTGKTLLDGSGAVTAVRGTVQDTTNRKVAEAEKEAMQAQLQQSRRLEAVGRLAGGVAHNFNNLLTGIMGSVEMARMDVVPGSPAASSLEIARAAAIKAAGLARQLSSFGRNAMVRPVVQNATSAVQASLELVCSSLPSSIDVVRDLTPDTWDVLVDSSQLTQVLLELTSNAREAMSDEGTITVHTSNVTVDSTYVATHSYARTGEFAVISVVDTGPGINPEITKHLFEPFATTKQFGRGMGLATVFGSINQAGGWVDVSSKQGAGTEVDLYLPRIMEEPTPPA